MSTTPRRARRLVPLLLIAVWLVVGGVLGPYAGRLGEVATNDQAAFLPRSAESTEVIAAQRAFRQDETLVAIVVWTGEGLSERHAAADRALSSLDGTPGVTGQVSPALLSEDRAALRGVVPLRPGLGDALPGALERIRAAAERVPGTTVRLAGPAASQADLSDAFAGIDGLLLAVALLTVLVILLLVYRSVLLPLVIILGAVFALGLACAVVYALADQGMVRVDGQVQGILSILVIGAATDYALLLTARFREELGARTDRFAAMRAALRQSWGAIVASAATVALGLLALLLSDLTNNRALGPVGAIGIGCAVLATLTFLPAVLVALGRAAYWPAAPGGPSAAAPRAGEGVWRRVAGLVDRAPRRVWALTLAALLAGPRSRPPSPPRASPWTRPSSTTRPPSPPRRPSATTSRRLGQPRRRRRGRGPAGAGARRGPGHRRRRDGGRRRPDRPTRRRAPGRRRAGTGRRHPGRRRGQRRREADGGPPADRPARRARRRRPRRRLHRTAVRQPCAPPNATHADRPPYSSASSC
ncbi:MMPL family transporter [Streptomyces stelliscabiei]|uniref:MMPL family transporter n=1 Tax=Streptomyces stelliscabiei TaxID=146820 RepID=UPI003A93838A